MEMTHTLKEMKPPLPKAFSGAFQGCVMKFQYRFYPMLGVKKKKNLQVTCGATRLQALHLGHNQETCIALRISSLTLFFRCSQLTGWLIFDLHAPWFFFRLNSLTW